MAKSKAKRCPDCHTKLEEKEEGKFWCPECKSWFKVLMGTVVALAALGTLSSMIKK